MIMREGQVHMGVRMRFMCEPDVIMPVIVVIVVTVHVVVFDFRMDVQMGMMPAEQQGDPYYHDERGNGILSVPPFP